MDNLELDKILQSIDATESWLHFGELAGTSDKIQHFVREVNSLAEEFQSLKNPGIVFVSRLGSCPRVDHAITNALGFDRSIVIELTSGAQVYNAIQLFGSGVRPGCFESSEDKVVIIGGDCISVELQQRFENHLNRWMSEGPRQVLLLGQSMNIDMDFGSAVEVASIEFSALRDRPEDIPYAIHRSAAHNSGGLDNFSIDSINQLLEYTWTDDHAQIDRFIRAIFVSASRDGPFRSQDVTKCLKRCADTRTFVSSPGIDSEWARVQGECDEIDRLTTGLLGTGFFSHDSAKIRVAPIGSHSPEFDFFRLVSWAYSKYIEDAEPNLRCIMKLCGGLGVPAEGLQVFRKELISLRTYYQHSIQFSSDHGQSVLDSAAKWFESAIGRRIPEERDHENCSRELLSQISRLNLNLLTFLKRLNRDQFRDVTLRQWVDRRETTWPKYRFDTLVHEALESQKRHDLDAQAVCKIMLPKLQEKLATLKEDASREKTIQSLIERELEERFRAELPITGRDLIELGCEQGPRIRLLLDELRRHFGNQAVEREEAISFARSLLSTQHEKDT